MHVHYNDIMYVSIVSHLFFIPRLHNRNRLMFNSYDPLTHDGTYVCRAENVAGIDVATIALSVGEYI